MATSQFPPWDNNMYPWTWLYVCVMLTVREMNWVLAFDISEDIVLPHGFRIATYTSQVPNARGLAVSTYPSAHIVYVSTRSLQNIYAVLDLDKDGVVDAVYIMLDDLQVPCGIAYREGSLFVAQVNRCVECANTKHYGLYCLCVTQDENYSCITRMCVNAIQWLNVSVETNDSPNRSQYADTLF